MQEIHTVCREIHGQERVPGGLRQNISGRSFGSCMMNHGESAEAGTPNRGGTMKKGDGKGTWQGYIQSEVDACARVPYFYDDFCPPPSNGD